MGASSLNSIWHPPWFQITGDHLCPGWRPLKSTYFANCSLLFIILPNSDWGFWSHLLCKLLIMLVIPLLYLFLCFLHINTLNASHVKWLPSLLWWIFSAFLNIFDSFWQDSTSCRVAGGDKTFQDYTSFCFWSLGIPLLMYAVIFNEGIPVPHFWVLSIL